MKELRELLVGSQLDDVQQRLGRFEAKIERALRELREDTQRRVEGLERYCREEVGELGKRLGEERETRSAEIAALRDEHGRRLETFARRVEDFEKRSSEHEQRVREFLLDEVKALREQFDARQDEVRREFSDEQDEVRRNKMDRASLASMLRDMASRVAGDESVGDADLEDLLET